MRSRLRTFGCLSALALALTLGGAGCGDDDVDLPELRELPTDEIPTDVPELPTEPPDDE